MMHTPIRRLLVLVATLCCLGTHSPAQPELSLEKLRVLRQEAASRQRRVIMNNDGNEPVINCTNPTPEELLRYRTTPLVGSQVDSIFYCTWSSGFSLFTHNTKVGQVFNSKTFWPNNITQEMLDAGTDPLRVMVDFGKKQGIEIFWSFRMNDTHDAGLSSYGPPLFQANKLKQQHPEWLVGSAEHRPKYGTWSSVDYSHAEIRDLAFRYAEEVCQNYNVDGIELDFFRHAFFFKRSGNGEPCTQQELNQMTDLMRRIRRMTEAEGQRRGRPILVAMRLPDSVEYCRVIGLDLERWLSEGLMDLLVPSGYIQLNPWTYSVALGRKYGVKVYPALDESRVVEPKAEKAVDGPAQSQSRNHLFSYRGRALNVWQSGADGVYFYNLFNPTHPIWREAGDPQKLARLDHDYFASVRGLGRVPVPHAKYVTIPILNPGQPIKVGTTTPAKVALQVGATLPTDTPPILTLRLRFKDGAPADQISVRLNGEILRNGSRTGDWLEFKLPPASIKTGVNDVSVSTTGSSSVWWNDLQLQVRYAQPAS